MKFDITQNMSDEEYEYHIKLKEKYFNWENNSCPDAPYWGDGPNSSEDDEYEDGDYIQYYDNLISPDEEDYISNMESNFHETKLSILENKWILVRQYNETPYYMLKWLHDRDISYIYLIHPIRFEQYLYLKNDRDVRSFKLKFFYKTATTADFEYVVNNYGWKFVSFKYDLGKTMYEYSPEIMYQWCDERCSGIFIFSNFSGKIRVLFEKPQDATMFKLKWE
jgi:hypothetical protein